MGSAYRAQRERATKPRITPAAARSHTTDSAKSGSWKLPLNSCRYRSSILSGKSWETHSRGTSPHGAIRFVAGALALKAKQDTIPFHRAFSSAIGEGYVMKDFAKYLTNPEAINKNGAKTPKLSDNAALALVEFRLGTFSGSEFAARSGRTPAKPEPPKASS